tara:strand:+ start:20674 stop:21441 length:768 start_codon:yes stop_codon:yes gene_type:complete
MRWAIAVVLLLTGCVGFHPLHPEWDKSGSAADASANRSLRDGPWQVIGHSHQGRPLRIRRIGNGPRRVIWIGGIHGNEREGSVSTAELPAALSRVPGALGQVTLTILEDINPDGTAHNRRGNAEGIDLNRNYPASNFLAGPAFGQRPLDQPESKALHDLVRAERPHLVIVAHSWRDDHFINFDGPAVRHAELFSEHSGYRVKPSDRIAPTPGSLGSWIGRTLGLPILTLEHHRGCDPWKCWLDTREAILAVILAA